MLLFLTDLQADSDQPVRSPFGVAGTLGSGAGHRWLHRAPGADPRAVIYAAKAAGATHLVSVEEVAGLNRLLQGGEWLVPDDYIEQTRGQPTTFFESRGMGYLQQSPAFTEALRARLCTAVAGTGEPWFPLGTYLAINSLRRLTPAEGRAARIWGADVAGARALPEATLARELEMGYAILAHTATTLPATAAHSAPPWSPAAPAELYALVERVDGGGLPSLEGSNSMARRLVGEAWQEWIG